MVVLIWYYTSEIAKLQNRYDPLLIWYLWTLKWLNQTHPLDVIITKTFLWRWAVLVNIILHVMTITSLYYPYIHHSFWIITTHAIHIIIRSPRKCDILLLWHPDEFCSHYILKDCLRHWWINHDNNKNIPAKNVNKYVGEASNPVEEMLFKFIQ